MKNLKITLISSMFFISCNAFAETNRYSYANLETDEIKINKFEIIVNANRNNISFSDFFEYAENHEKSHIVLKNMLMNYNSNSNLKDLLTYSSLFNDRLHEYFADVIAINKTTSSDKDFKLKIQKMRDKPKYSIYKNKLFDFSHQCNDEDILNIVSANSLTLKNISDFNKMKKIETDEIVYFIKNKRIFSQKNLKDLRNELIKNINSNCTYNYIN